MSPPTSLRDRIRLRLRSRSAIEAERDDAVANAAQGWRRSAERWRDEFDQVGAILCERGYHAHEGWGVLASDVRQALDGVRAQHGRDVDAIASALGILTGPGIAINVDTLVEVIHATRGRARLVEHLRDELASAPLLRNASVEDLRDALAARGVATRVDDSAVRELDAVRDELRATHHQVGDPRGLSYDVDIAIDTERERGQDLVERLAEVLGWGSRSSWPHAAPHLVRAVAVRLGKPMPRWRPHRNAWPVGSHMARALACTCRGERGFGPSSVVDARCPEHSPGRRFGRSARPLALPATSGGLGDREWRRRHWDTHYDQRAEVPF